MADTAPILNVIAGANGTGKSTFAQVRGLDTIDPDRISAGYGQGFTPAANLRASREALELMQVRLQARQSFALETTLAGRQPLRLMRQALDTGYTVHLALIVASSGEDTRLRIDNRVLRGGHNIPDQDLQRRAPRILANLPEAVALASLTAIYVSSVQQQDFVLEGAADQAQVELTLRLPLALVAALSARLAVRQVGAVSPLHPASALFPSHQRED